METFTPFDSADYLQDDEDIRPYLEACLAENTGDGRLIAQALGTISVPATFRAWPTRSA